MEEINNKYKGKLQEINEQDNKYRVFGFINFSFQLPMFIFSDCKSLVHTKKSTLADAHTLKNKK
jgi:hypothetical protein